MSEDWTNRARYGQPTVFGVELYVRAGDADPTVDVVGFPNRWEAEDFARHSMRRPGTLAKAFALPYPVTVAEFPYGDDRVHVEVGYAVTFQYDDVTGTSDYAEVPHA